MVSKRWTLNSEEINKVAKNAVIFFTPVILIYLGAFVIDVRKDGFQLSDFVPSATTVTAIMLWLGNTAIDTLRKFSEGK